MKREEIIETIKSLAGSQGFYGRLYGDLMELDEDEYDEVMTKLESQNFKDGVDLVMFIESQEKKIMTLNMEINKNQNKGKMNLLPEFGNLMI